MATKGLNRKQRRAEGSTASMSMPAPGILKGPSFVAIEIEGVPRVENFFYSNAFEVRRVGSEVRILFAQVSHFFSNPNLLDLLEIVCPIDSMIDHFKQSIFELSEDSNKKRPFYETLADTCTKYAKKYVSENEDSYEINESWLSQVQNDWRQYGANYTYVSLSRGQAMIEFFEANPALLAGTIKDRKVRPGDGVRSVASVIMVPGMLKSFIDIVSECLSGPDKILESSDE